MRAGTLPEPADRGLLVNVFRSWDRFWFTPADPTTLSFIRLCCGLLVFYVHLGYSWGLLSYVGPNGWINHDIASWIQQKAPVYALRFDWEPGWVQIGEGNYYWSLYYHVTDGGWIIAIHTAILVSMLLFALGLWTRVTSVLSWIGAMGYVQRANSTVFGLDTMMMIVLLYLMVGPSGAVLSLDRWLAKRRARLRGEPEPPVEPSVSANFAIRLIQVHFCIVYFASGTSKLLGAPWWNGTALNLVVLNVAFAPMDNELYYQTMKFLATYRPLWEVVMTGSVIYTLALEISFPYLIWDQRWRWLLIICSVLLHAGIGLCMGLVAFSLMMMIMVLSFIPPEVIRGFVTQVGAVFAPRASPKPSVPRTPAELVLSR